MNKKTLVIVAGIVLLLAFFLGASWFKGQQAEKGAELSATGSTTLEPADAPTVGSKDARVTIVEFFDPACETCRVFHAPVKNLVKAHGGKVRLVLRYAPFHPGSDVMVKILEASRRQSKYHETLDLMFATQPLWASHHHPQPEKLWEMLPEAGLDVARIRQDINDPALDALVQRELADAATLGIRKTPGFLVNGKPLTSFGYEQLKALVESEIAEQY